MKMPTCHKNEHGVALVISLVFIALLGMLGTTAYVMTSTDLKIGSNYRASAEAFFDADAGINYGEAMIEAAHKANPSFMPTVIGDPADPTDANSVSLASFTAPTGFGFSFQAPGLTLVYDDPNTYRYTCTGTGPSNSTASITVTAKFKPVIEFGVFGDKKVDVGNTAGIYSYSSSSGTAPTSGTSTGEGDTGSNESVILRNGCVVDGDVALGDDGAGTEGALTNLSGVVLGDDNVDIDRVDPDPLGVVGGDYASEFSLTGKDNGNASLVCDPDGSISGINIDIGNGDTLTLKGKSGGANYYFDDIKLKNSSILYLDTTNGPVNIYLSGEIDAITGSNFINTTDATCSGAGTCCTCAAAACAVGLPGDFAIFANSQSSTDKISIGNSVDFSGFIYAPYLTVRMDNGADIFGAIIGREVEIANSVEIYFDTDMKDDYTTNDLILTTWRDVRTP